MYNQNNFTVGQWCDRWFYENESRWSGNTVGGYRNLIDRHISPGIGKIPLTELTQDTVTGFYDSLQSRGTQRQKCLVCASASAAVYGRGGPRPAHSLQSGLVLS